MSTTEPQVKRTHHVKIVRQVVEQPVQATPPKHDAFHHVSSIVSAKLGSPYAFAAAIIFVAIWASTGPLFGFSNTWQLVINTGTTIATFLMVFVIQNTQNRDSKAMQLKLNELLLKNSQAARTEYVDIEDLTDAELDVMQDQFKAIHEKFQQRADKSASSKHS